MSGGNGQQPYGSADKGLGEIVAEVSEKASQLVREEVALAKAEVTDKISKLAKGAGVAAAAGVFAIFGVVMLFHTIAWLITDALNSSPWVGFAIVTGALFLFAGLAGLLAFRFIKKGSPPTPELAIEEAKITRQELEGQKVQRDQVGRSLERGEEVRD
jgi:uncharacterized membrane protein YqjE